MDLSEGTVNRDEVRGLWPVSDDGSWAQYEHANQRGLVIVPWSERVPLLRIATWLAPSASAVVWRVVEHSDGELLASALSPSSPDWLAGSRTDSEEREQATLFIAQHVGIPRAYFYHAEEDIDFLVGDASDLDDVLGGVAAAVYQGIAAFASTLAEFYEPGSSSPPHEPEPAEDDYSRPHILLLRSGTRADEQFSRLPALQR